MKIALIGASGNIGTEIAKEALRRGHQVVGIVRNPERLAPEPNLTSSKGDANDPALTEILRGADAVALSVPFGDLDGSALLDAVQRSDVPRLAVVGGAGSLLADGRRVVDSPDFPEAWKSEALAAAAFLELLRAQDDLDWTFLSPSAMIAPGERTGRFRLGDDELLVGEDGQSRISQADYAIAFVDELENPRHSRRRFTVGY